jgi:8-oxo-dGTP pyrophosphatase MutT (NUDIX family)
MIVNKVCPVVLRGVGSALEVLAFEHPEAGYQLIKGSIESGESIEVAALRELAEESGIERAVVTRHLGIWHSGFEGQVWGFIECAPIHVLPESWVHRVADDGGHSFRFFWHPLSGPMPTHLWHALFRNALTFMRDRPNELRISVARREE